MTRPVFFIEDDADGTPTVWLADLQPNAHHRHPQALLARGVLPKDAAGDELWRIITAAVDARSEIACLTCEDKGEFVPPGSDVLLPCPDCARGDGGWREELLDEATWGVK